MEMVYCDRNRIKFTREACEKAKEKYPVRCKGCDGPVACEPIDTSVIKAKPGKGDDVSSKRVCAKCGQEKTIVCRGLCGRCRNEEIEAGTIDQNYPAKRTLFKNKKVVAKVATEQKSDKVVPIGATPKKTPPKKKKTDNSIRKVQVSFFERDRELLEQLVKNALTNRRSLADEILFRVENGAA